MTRRVPRRIQWSRLVPAGLLATVAFRACQSFVPHAPRVIASPERALAAGAVPALVEESVSDPFVAGKPGRAGGGGDDGPTPEEKIQVILYRSALVTTAICWWLIYTLDFFMTSGISIIDGSTQAAAIGVANVSASVAAIAAPTGSRVIAGVLLKLLGLATIVLAVLGLSAPGSLGAVAGPVCLVLVCAREVFWFGVFYKVDALWALLLFAGVAGLRFAATSASASEALAPESPAFESWDQMPTVPTLYDVRPVGPPLLLSFGCWVSLSVLAVAKLFEPIGEDLDEDGERWTKRSSRSLYDDPDPPGS